MAKKTNHDYEAIGLVLAKVVPEVSFMLFRKDEFRQFTDFDQLSQTDQDRIFNELEVAFLGLFLLYLENLDQETKDFLKPLSVKSLATELVNGFITLFKEMGIEEQFLKMWEQLIEMRTKEYRTDYNMLIKEADTSKTFKDEEEWLKIRWARSEAITLALVQHIRKGELHEGDPLIKYLREWVVMTETLFADVVKKSLFQPKAES